MKKSVIASIPSFVVITTFVYAQVATTLFETNNNVLGNGENFIVDDVNDKILYSQQQAVVETQCKSTCPYSSEMCIKMCA